MRIVVDGKDASVESVGTGTVGQAYDLAVGRMQLKGRTALSVRLDGRLVTHEERLATFARPVSGCQVMDLETVDTRQLMRATLLEVRRHLGPLREALRSALVSLAAVQRVKALETLKPTLEVWMAVCEAVAKVGILMGHDLSKPIVGSTSVEDVQQAVLRMLEETQNVFAEHDWAGLSRVIEQEFLPLVDRWEQICHALEAEAPSERP